jgi:hypothetical protein
MTTWHTPVNFASTTISTGALFNTDSPVTFAVSDGSVFGSSFPLWAVVDPTGSHEVLEVTARSGNNLTATRTSPVQHAGAPSIICSPAAEYITELQSAVDAMHSNTLAEISTTTPQSLTGGSHTLLTLETVNYDTGSYTTTSNQFSINATGYYIVALEVTFAAATNILEITISKNGAVDVGVMLASQKATQTSFQFWPLNACTGVVKLNASDYVQGYAYAGSTMNTAASAVHPVRFSIVRVA